MNANAYLHFNCQCEEAFSVYAQTFGGEIASMMRWADMPGAGVPVEMQRMVMHASLNIGTTTIFGSDAPPDRYSKPSGFGIALRVDTEDDAERIFKELSEGGNVTMPMSETFFAYRFGMVTDRFAVPWMVVCNKE